MAAARPFRLLATASAVATLVANADLACLAGTDGVSPACSSAADAPSTGNAQIQSSGHKLQRRGLEPESSGSVDVGESDEGAMNGTTSLASLSRGKRVSRQMQLYAASDAISRMVTGLNSTWDASTADIDKMLGGMADGDSAAKDGCSAQLLEYKHKLKVIHESTLSISTEVSSTSSEVGLFEKECKEKNQELNQIDVVHDKRVKKCRTERKETKKKLKALRFDMKEMKKVSRARISLKKTKKTTALLDERHSPKNSPSPSLAHVQGMVAQTKAVAARAATCLAKSKAAAGRRQAEAEVEADAAPIDGVSLVEVSPQILPDAKCHGAKPRCFPVMCGIHGWECGEVAKCPAMMPKCHPVSCVRGKWKCGAISDSAYLACKGQEAGDECNYKPSEDANEVSGTCTPGHPFELDFLSTSTDVVGAGKRHKDLDEFVGLTEDDDTQDDNKNSEDKERSDAEDGVEDVDGARDDDNKNSEDKERSDAEDGVEDVDGARNDASIGGNSLLKSASTAKRSSVAGIPPRPLRCLAPDSPTECKEVIIELEHQFTESYVSLTRMIEEYSTVTHSTVCEDSVEQEFTEESTAVQDEANEVCTEVQEELAMLEKFKFEYHSTVKTEHAMEKNIKNMVKQCGRLDSTEIYLKTVKSTLDALGSCPGIGDIAFQLPTWVGEWVRFRQRRSKTNKWNDKRMLKKCKKKFGDTARVAEVSEIDTLSVEGMPKTNIASYPVLGACPECKGKRMKGVSRSGFGRICWDTGAKFGRQGRKRDCAGGVRAVLCVYDA